MAVGQMTPYLLASFVSGPPATTLEDIPMWFGMFYSDPLAAMDPLTVEIVGAGYDRPDAVWTAYGTTGLVTSGDTAFLALPIGTHGVSIGLWDADVNGNLLAAANLDPADYVDLPGGGSWVMPAGEFFLGFDLTGL